MGVMEAAHPYMPVSMELPGFHPALMSQAFILATYGGASAVVVLIVWLLSGGSGNVGPFGSHFFLSCIFSWGFGGCGSLML